MKIGIILINYCGFNDTVDCIKSILNANRYGIKIEICIIDNNSPKEKVSIELLQLALDDSSIYSNNYCLNKGDIYIDNLTIKVINSEKNGGFGYANNIGITYFKSKEIDICILLNNDTQVDSNFFSYLYKQYENISNSYPKIAISPLSINYYDHILIDSKGFGYIDLYTGRSSHKKKYKCKYLIGSCIIMNNVSSIPLFDENFFLYCEDVDFSITLEQLGYSLFYDEKIIIYHKVSASTTKNKLLETIKLQSMKYLIKKHGTLLNQSTFYILRSIYYIKNWNFTLLEKLWRT